MKVSKSKCIKELRKIIGDTYYDDERRGAKTNEFGMTKSQVIALAHDIHGYFEVINTREYEDA